MIEYRFKELFDMLKAKKGMTSVEIASRTGLDRMTLNRLAKARSVEDFDVRLKTIDRICTGLEVGLNKVVYLKRK